MTHQNLRNTYPTKTSSFAELSFLELIQEMKLMDIDPKPFLRVAANDIFSKHGVKSITYADLMLTQMSEDDNPNGLLLWKELYNILNELISAPHITLH